jgi:hypothetical protein
MSVNRSHRSGVDEGGTGSPAHENGKHDSSGSTQGAGSTDPLGKVAGV